MSDTMRDRLTRLETDVKHLTVAVDKMAAKVNELHDVLTKAKGAKWAVVSIAGVTGFVSAKAAAFLPFLPMAR